jgi:uncharacterized lipoprotein
MRKLALSSACSVAILAGCSTTTTTEQADLLDQPIDCATADVDIAALETAIPGAAQRVAAGVRLIIPVSRIVGRATGKLDDRREIASGRTEDDLRARIEEIKAACPDAQK